MSAWQEGQLKPGRRVGRTFASLGIPFRTVDVWLFIDFWGDGECSGDWIVDDRFGP